MLTVDPPPLMVLNEPETSLHPDLLPPLARLIRTASERTQLVVVSHSQRLVDELGVTGEDTDDADDAADVPPGLGSRARRITLVKDLGETFVDGQGLLTMPPWHWGTRR